MCTVEGKFGSSVPLWSTVGIEASVAPNISDKLTKVWALAETGLVVRKSSYGVRTLSVAVLGSHVAEPVLPDHTTRALEG